jgi:hypothetical protein
MVAKRKPKIFAKILQIKNLYYIYDILLFIHSFTIHVNDYELYS